MAMPAAATDGSWVVYIKRQLGAGSCSGSYDLESMQNPTICRVPAPLHSVRPSAFTPQTVVIGPFHRKMIREGEYAFSFAQMEGYKIMAARATCQRRPGGDGDFACLAQGIALEEEKVRACFSKHLGLDDLGKEELGYMLALDCTFIVAILHSLYNDENQGALGRSGLYPVYERRFSHALRKAVMLDLMLLENQVPLFLVKKVMEMDERYGDVEAMFQEFVDTMVAGVLPFCKEIRKVGGKANHLLDCLYTIVTHGSNNPTKDRLDVLPVAIVPTATELHRAGVEFKGHHRSLSEISFDGHIKRKPGRKRKR